MSQPYQQENRQREDFDALPGDIILEFGANDCPQCQSRRDMIDAALASRPGWQRIGIEDGPGRRLGRSYRVKLWPTLIVLHDGKETARRVRPDTPDEVRALLA